MKRFRAIFTTILSFVLFSACFSNTGTESRLAAIDRLLVDDPTAALDSLTNFPIADCSGGELAYYQLLLVIAQHKNGIVAESDSVISSARVWFAESKDYFNQARSLFYNGVVIFEKYVNDTLAFNYMQDARRIIELHPVENDRFKALLFSYLGKAHSERDNNFEEAINCYNMAIPIEIRLGNYRNLIIDYSNLAVCQIQAKRMPEATATLGSLDSLIALHPEIRLNAPNNTKAIYYVHGIEDLDSALFYANKVKTSDPVAEGSRQMLLSNIYQRQGKLDSAIRYQKLALGNHLMKDHQTLFVYYQKLSDLYSQTGPADSAAHYARMAYAALHDNLDEKTQKRILELEKKYDVAEQAAKFERMRHSRNVILLLLAFTLAVCALFFWQWRLLRKNVAMRQREALRDSIFKSVLQAAAVTYAGVNKKLAHIHNLPAEKKQEALAHFIQDNKIQSANNLLSAVEMNIDKFPETVQQVTSSLDGAQQKTVFVLTELEFSPGDISGMLGITSAQVRMVKKLVRDRIGQLDIGGKQAAHRLKVMQLGTQVGKK